MLILFGFIMAIQTPFVRKINQSYSFILAVAI